MAEKIMVVDDEKDIVFLLRDYFSFNDYEVITAYNVQQATEKLGGKISFGNDNGATVRVEV